jgi:hypothetical protein
LLTDDEHFESGPPSCSSASGSARPSASWRRSKAT